MLERFAGAVVKEGYRVGSMQEAQWIRCRVYDEEIGVCGLHHVAVT